MLLSGRSQTPAVKFFKRDRAHFGGTAEESLTNHHRDWGSVLSPVRHSLITTATSCVSEKTHTLSRALTVTRMKTDLSKNKQTNKQKLRQWLWRGNVNKFYIFIFIKVPSCYSCNHSCFLLLPFLCSSQGATGAPGDQGPDGPSGIKVRTEINQHVHQLKLWAQI